MKRAKFYLERVVVSEKKYIKVLCWENVLELFELPNKYLLRNPHFYCLSESHSDNKRRKIRVHYKNFYEDIYENSYIEREHWKELRKYMKQAGERLSRILEEERWTGMFKIEI